MKVKKQIAHDIFRTPFGWMGVVYTLHGVRRIFLPRPSLKDLQSALRSGVEAGLRRPWPHFRQVALDYFEGRGPAPDLRLDLPPASPFVMRVRAATQRIPPGVTVTYGDLARRVGSPLAAQAVGQVMARNPAPLIVPCHRVVGAGSELGGFSGGLELKRRLLALERERTGGVICEP